MPHYDGNRLVKGFSLEGHINKDSLKHAEVPCPFCGSKNLRKNGQTGGDGKLVWIECFDCGSNGPKVNEFEVPLPRTWDMALRKWGERTK